MSAAQPVRPLPIGMHPMDYFLLNWNQLVLRGPEPTCPRCGNVCSSPADCSCDREAARSEPVLTAADLVECAGPCGGTYLADTCIEVRPDQGGGPSMWLCSQDCESDAREWQVTG